MLRFTLGIFDLQGLDRCIKTLIVPNRVNREFTVEAPDCVWITDITYIWTWQGWLYLAVVLDLYSRSVEGWSMKPTIAKELALDEFDDSGLATKAQAAGDCAFRLG